MPLSSAGFTLLEMIVAVGIFAVVMILAIGVAISISNARIKTANIQNVQDNIRYSLDLIGRELRIGSKYETLPLGCYLCNQINFRWTDPRSTAFELRGYCRDVVNGRGVIRRLLAGETDCSKGGIMTAENVNVERLYFLVSGQDPGALDGHPWVTILLRVSSTDPKAGLGSAMDIQTTVVQRLPDR